jgi:PhnB protein
MQSEPSAKSTRVKGIPDNSSIIMPRLVCRDPGREIDFCVDVFEAVVLNRRPGPDGTVWHGLLTIREEMIMIEAEVPGLPSKGPTPDGSSPVIVFVYVPDVDKTVERAIERGAKVLVPPKDQFWGDRTAWIMDPNGHVWTVASRVEETTGEERSDRWSKILSEQKKT